MRLRHLWIACILAALGAGPAQAQTPPPSRVLRVAPHADLRTLDPIFASIVITRMHGLMIYETLFAWDSALQPRPQMVERWEVSPDSLTWTFTLREELRFHDGQPVTSRDVIASLNRWMQRDTVGGKLREYTAGLEVLDDRRFVLRLSRPTGFVTFALGSAVGQIPAIMRESDARTDPNRPVTETIGSGPFRFNRAEWRSGSRIVYDRNPDYVPRPEPPDGLAGGRVVKLDRVEWQIMPDPGTAAAALQAGEIDIWEQPALDLVPLISRNREVRVERLTKLSTQAMLRPNSLYPPFNDPRARQALALIGDQADFMAAGYGDERWWHRCRSYFVCGGPYGTEAGTEWLAQPNLERARQLLAEAGYRGEKLVMITSFDIAPIGRMAEVAADALRRAGVAVDLQVSDWGTVTTRQPRRDPPDQGGWNLFVTNASGPTMHHPLTNIGTNMSCERAWVGWPCDAEAERLRAAALDATDDAERHRLVEALHRRLAEMQPYRVLGQFDQPYARRANVTGVLQAPVMVFWNIEKH